MNDFSVFKKINQIIAEDSKSATYKLALLRGTIDIIIENSPYIEKDESRVHIPMGLLIEKWILYYYPLYAADVDLRQITSPRTAFEKYLLPIIDYYKQKNGISMFYNDLTVNGIPEEINSKVIDLVKQLRKTIVTQPMHYIGSSIEAQGQIFIPKPIQKRLHSTQPFSKSILIESMGSFSIPRDYNDAFQVLGSFINGQESILVQWAQFSHRLSKNASVEKVLSTLQETPIVKRDAEESKAKFKALTEDKVQRLQCIWSGEIIKGNTYHVDHIIPFSIWKNNDLWNLLPASQAYNSSKSNSIPSPDLIRKQRDLFYYYWDIIREENADLFDAQLQLTLLGNEPIGQWKEAAIDQLASTSDYLINVRGFQSWKPK